MVFPNFNPHVFAQLSPRERMMQQLMGRGFGSVGMVEVLQGSNGGGQVGVLRGTNHLGIDFTSQLSPTAPTVQMLSLQPQLSPVQEPRPYVAPESGSARILNRVAAETTLAPRVLDTPSPSVGTEVVPEDPSIPDTDVVYATGTRANPEDVHAYERGTPDEAHPWETAPHGDPLYLPDEAPAPAPPNANPAQQAQAILAQPSGGIPWWGYALGAAAVGFGLYKLGGRKR